MTPAMGDLNRPLQLPNHLPTVRVQALLIDTRSVFHASRWICHSSCQQSVAVFNTLWKQKLINNFNYCPQKTLPLKWRHSDVMYMVLIFVNINGVGAVMPRHIGSWKLRESVGMGTGWACPRKRRMMIAAPQDTGHQGSERCKSSMYTECK